MNLFTVENHSAGITLVVDGSGVDLAAYRRGELKAQIDFIGFLEAMETEIQGLVAKNSHKKISVVLTGLTCPGAPVYRPVETRGLDEILTYRDRLRRLLSKSTLCQVPSLFIGRGHLCSPVLELSQLCLLRVWRDDASLMFTTPNSWVDNLIPDAPTNRILREVGGGEGDTVQSLDHAKNIGLIDALITGPSSDDGQIIEQFYESGFNTAIADYYGPNLDRQMICSIRKSEAVGAFGSARERKYAPSKLDGANAEFREIEYVRRCLQNERLSEVPDKQQNHRAGRRSDQLKTFALAMDLSEAIPNPEFLTEISRDISMILVTAQSAEQLISGNERLRHRFTQAYGGVNASAFWEQSVVPALGTPNGKSSVSTLMPLRNGGYRLTSPNGGVVSLRVNDRETLRITCPSDDTWVKLINSWPELQIVTKAFDVPVIPDTDPDFDFLKTLFYALFVAYGVDCGFPPSGLRACLQSIGLDHEFAMHCADSYGSQGIKLKATNTRLPFSGSDRLIMEYLRHYSVTFAHAFAEDELTASFLLSLLLSYKNLKSEKLGYRWPIFQELKFRGIGRVKFATFRPFGVGVDQGFFSERLFPTHSRVVRQHNFGQKIREFLQGLDQQRRDYFEQTTKVKGEAWLKQMMY